MKIIPCLLLTCAALKCVRADSNNIVNIPLEGLTQTTIATENSVNLNSEEDIYSIKDMYFIGQINLGTPRQDFYVVFDTTFGSLWVPSFKLCSDQYYCDKHETYTFKNSRTAERTRYKYSQPYGKENITGNVIQDMLSVGGLVVNGQTFGSVSDLPEVFKKVDVDGIFGLSFTPLKGTDAPFINMISNDLLQDPVFSFYFSSDDSDLTGELTLGGVNDIRYNGSFTYVPLVTNDYWLISIDGVVVCNILIADDNIALLDTSTSYFFGPRTAIYLINKAIGGTINQDNGLFFVDCDKIETFPVVKFLINGLAFPVYPENYIFKNFHEDGSVDCWSKFKGTDLSNFVLGIPFMQLYYTQFDAGNSRVGLAPAV